MTTRHCFNCGAETEQVGLCLDCHEAQILADEMSPGDHDITLRHRHMWTARLKTFDVQFTGYGANPRLALADLARRVRAGITDRGKEVADLGRAEQ